MHSITTECNECGKRVTVDVPDSTLVDTLVANSNMVGTTWINHGSAYMVKHCKENQMKLELIRIVRTESVVILSPTAMKELLKNFKQIG